MSLNFVILRHAGVISHQERPLQKSYKVDMFKDSHAFCKTCENYQKLGSISKRHMMPLNPIFVIEIFDCWGIDFMGPFPPSFCFLYILVAVDYVSKWIEAILSRNNDHKTVIKFLKENILSRLESLEP